ncbi:MAG: ATP-binding protein [Limisphaerales bacterium]
MRTLSIRRKLLTALLVTSTSVLLLAGISLLSYEVSSYRRSTERSLSTLAQAIAADSAGALFYGDEKTTREILSGLRAEPDIVAAALYEKSGKLHVSWSPGPGDARVPAHPGPDGLHFEHDQLIAVQPVMQNGQRVGTLFVRQNLQGMFHRVQTYIGVLLFILAGATAIAVALSRFYEQRLTRPILALAGTARRVSEHKDFSLRAPRTAPDELGRLTDAFNEMLSEIQEQQRRLLGELAARQKAETELRESEERFRTMADNIVQLAWTADKLGWPTWFNQRWYEYTGASAAQMEGRGWEGFIHPDHLERVRGTVQISLERSEVWEDTFPIRNKDGVYRWFLSRAIPMRDGHGVVVRWFGTNTDIDEQKREEQRLEQAVAERTAQLREANENLQTFSYTAAHDLRSPLRSIRSFSAVIMEDFAAQLDPEARSYLERVVRSADQMEHLLNDLLEYSRITQGPLLLENTSLQTAVHDALSFLHADVQAKKAVVTVAEPLPSVKGHQATVVLLVQNLVGNALKFTSAGVQPKIHIRAEPASTEAFPESQEHTAPGPRNPETEPNMVRLIVQDNGIGVEPKDLPRLFTAFQRLHGGKAYPGTGLGLAIVRKGAERMGGRVGVESQPGQGSCFWIELPGIPPNGATGGPTPTV